MDSKEEGRQDGLWKMLITDNVKLTYFLSLKGENFVKDGKQTVTFYFQASAPE